jgi:CBS-domain-containing membrane protein
MRASSVSVDEDATPGAILAAMDHAGVDDLPVVTNAGAFRGMVVRRAVERRLYDAGEEDATAASLTEEPLARATSEQPLERAVDAMLAADLEAMPVVSSSGELEGLLVREDLKEVPGLIDVVREERRQRELAAEAGPSKVILACSLASVVLGLVLFAMWVQGPANGLPRWVAWVDGIAAALAFVGAVTAFAREMISIPVWGIAGVALLFSSATAYAWHDGPGSTWVQFAFGVVFLLMAGALGIRWPRRRRAALGAA